MARNTIEKKYLNRYTSLPFLFDTLYNKRLTLVDPARWEDENDAYFMKLYKTKSGHRSVLALCFAEYQRSTTEKYHNWKIYAGSSSGVCIQFFRDRLISCIGPVLGISYKSVTYKTISRFDSDWHKISWHQLPFIKRKAFDGETEFRIIYESDSSEELDAKRIPIELSSISRIILNPWIPQPVYDAVCSAINSIEGCDNLHITQTNILNYAKWKKAGENIAKLNGDTIK